jgi:hypothetical protein
MPAVDRPRVVEVWSARRASERPLPRTPQERPTHEPAREVELRLSPASTPRSQPGLLLPTQGLVVTVLGDRRRRGTAGLADENP